jgi:hypothetical protein
LKVASALAEVDKMGSSPLFRNCLWQSLSLCHSERSEESETLDNQRFRFFALLRMTKKFFSFLKSGEEP